MRKYVRKQTRGRKLFGQAWHVKHFTLVGATLLHKDVHGDRPAARGVFGEPQLIRGLARPSMQRVEHGMAVAQRGEGPGQRPYVLAVLAQDAVTWATDDSVVELVLTLYAKNVPACNEICVNLG